MELRDRTSRRESVGGPRPASGEETRPRNDGTGRRGRPEGRMEKHSFVFAPNHPFTPASLFEVAENRQYVPSY